MALEGQLGGDGDLFVGEDKTLKLEILDKATQLPVDIAGWAIKWEARKTDHAADPAKLSKTASVEGVYDGSSRAANTQRAVVVLSDDDTNAVSGQKATPEDAPYRYAWKRMDDGVETVLRYGDLVLQESTVR